jgi:hypothetical protein
MPGGLGGDKGEEGLLKKGLRKYFVESVCILIASCEYAHARLFLSHRRITSATATSLQYIREYRPFCHGSVSQRRDKRGTRSSLTETVRNMVSCVNSKQGENAGWGVFAKLDDGNEMNLEKGALSGTKRRGRPTAD